MNLPERHKQNLIEAHKECAEIIRRYGSSPEPIQTAISCEEHRWFWKPKDVKFILVGESHVYTNKDEIKVKIISTRLPKEVPKTVPRSFVKLVYCLGYGEPSILDKPEKIESNPGTKQYDALFKMCAGEKGNPSGMMRLRWKAKILTTLKKKGFWLLDASCHACSFGKRKRLPSKIVKEIVPTSWRIYVKPIIEETLTSKKRIWIIGKGLHNVLRLHDEFVSNLNWIYQPNAYFKNPKKYIEKRSREQQLRKTIEQYFSEKHGTPDEMTHETSSPRNEHAYQNRSEMNNGGLLTSERQAQFAKFVEELKQRGIKGREYRGKIMQWNKRQKD